MHDGADCSVESEVAGQCVPFVFTIFEKFTARDYVSQYFICNGPAGIVYP